jgi:hypothetical protein
MNYAPHTAPMYNLIWIVNGIAKETIMWSKPIGLVKWKKRVLNNTTHRFGELKIVKNGKKNQSNIAAKKSTSVQSAIPF